MLPKLVERIESLWNLLQRLLVEPFLPKLVGRIDSQLPLLNWICSYFGNFSQSTACNATRFGECSSTLLDRLWYTYSYIYHRASSNTTTIITRILLSVGVVVLVTTTDQSTKLSIVSPSPHLSQTRSFTMTDYTTITNYSFSFSDHPTCPAFSTTLNNTGSEPFVKNIAVSLFTNTAKTTVATDIIPVLHAAIIDTVMISFTADQTIVAPISNSMLLFAYGGNPSRKFMLCSVGTITTAFNATVAANRHAVIIQLNIATVSVDPHNFTVMDFGGLSLTGPIRHTTYYRTKIDHSPNENSHP